MNECKDKILKAAKLEEWRYANCPLDKETLGRGTWGLLHNAAIKYPNKPNSLQQVCVGRRSREAGRRGRDGRGKWTEKADYRSSKQEGVRTRG